MATEAQNLSREMILPAYKAAILPGPPPNKPPIQPSLPTNYELFYAKQAQFAGRSNERKVC